MEAANVFYDEGEPRRLFGKQVNVPRMWGTLSRSAGKLLAILEKKGWRRIERYNEYPVYSRLSTRAKRWLRAMD